MQAYQRAIARAVRRHKQEDGEAHVLDLGCGTGILSLMAARAGASSGAHRNQWEAVLLCWHS